MRWTSSTIILLLAVIAWHGCGGGKEQAQEASSADESSPAPVIAAVPAKPNAAAEYRKLDVQFSETLMDLVSGTGGWRSVDAATAKALMDTQPSIAQLITATQMEHCDFGINPLDSKQRVEHLRSIRKFVLVLNADALRIGASGSIGAPPGDRVAAMVRLSRQTTRDEMFLCKLNGAATIGLAARTAGDLVEHQVVNDAGKKAMLAEFRAFETGSGLMSPVIIANERSMMIPAIRSGTIGADDVFGVDDMSAPARETIARELDEALAQIEKAWNSPNASAELKSIETRAKDATARKFVGLYVKGHEGLDKAQRQVRSIISRLEHS